MGVLAAEADFLKEDWEVERHTARIPLRFASFHFFEVVNAGFVVGTGSGWILRILGLRE